MTNKSFKNRVEKGQFEFEEEVRDFTGLIFHCPTCDETYHLHIATVRLIPKKVKKANSYASSHTLNDGDETEKTGGVK